MAAHQRFLRFVKRLDVGRDGHHLMVDVGHPFGLQFLPQLTVEQQVAALAHRAPMLGPAGLPTPRCDADVEVAIDGVGAALAENMLVEDERVTRSRRITGDRISRSEEHTSELQSLMRISYAVFCLKKKKKYTTHKT